MKRETSCGHEKHYAKGMCKGCYDKDWLGEGPKKKARLRRYNIKKYGITQEEYETLLAAQGGVCAICKTFELFKGRKYMTIDHCHKTGVIRGILCCRCNSALGNFKDDITVLESAISYLKFYTTNKR